MPLEEDEIEFDVDVSMRFIHGQHFGQRNP